MQFALIILIKTLHLLIIQVLSLKTEEECFFLIQIPVKKKNRKSAIWTTFCFWVSSPEYTNWEFMLLIQQSHI